MTLSSSNEAEIQGSRTLNLGDGWSLEEAKSFVEACFDRDALISALLGFCARWLPRRLLIVLANQRAQPYLICGWGELDEAFGELSALRALRLAVEHQNPLVEDWRAGRSVVGAPEELGFGSVFVGLKLFPPERLFAQAIRIGARPAMVLIAEETEQRDPSASAQIKALAEAVGEQLTRVLTLSKAGKLPPQEERIPPLPTRDEGEAAGESTPSEVARERSNPTHDGLPFADESTSGTVQLLDSSRTAFGLPLADAAGTEELFPMNRGDDSSDASAEGAPEHTADGESGATQRFDHLFAESEDPAAPSRTISGGFSSASPTGQTILGGFESLKGIPESAKTIMGGFNADSASALGPRSTLSGGFSVDSTAQDDAEGSSSGVPMAQIVRPISLKYGRKSLAGARSDALADEDESSPGVDGD